jgi:3-hydroxybutyrate dehydrogenase
MNDWGTESTASGAVLKAHAIELAHRRQGSQRLQRHRLITSPDARGPPSQDDTWQSGVAVASSLSTRLRAETTMVLQDKVAIVTGAATPISKAIARNFMLEGAWVAMTDLDQKVAVDAARTIDPSGRHVMGVAMDVADGQQVDDATGTVVQAFGGLDILVNYADIRLTAPPVDFDFADWKRTLSTTLDGAYLTARAALGHMYKQKSGCIIFVTPAFSTETPMLEAPQVTAAHGLLGLAKVVAAEGAAHAIRVNVICLGRAGNSEEDVVKNLVAKGENGQPADVAEVALFLASFGSDALTGRSVVLRH